MATHDDPPDDASSSGADRPQDPRVERLRPDPSQSPQAALTLAGFLGDSDRAGYRRLYFTRSLDSYAEFRAEEVLHVQPIGADEQPFPGEEATRVTLRRDATVEYTRTRVARPLDEFDLDIRLGGRRAPAPRLPNQITEETCGGATCACGETSTCWFTCPGCGLTSETCDGCGTDITCASCRDTCGGPTCRATCQDTCLRTDCQQATCDTCRTDCAGTCRTDCFGATCRTCQTRCGQATCATCAGQATCQTCAGQATCVTCQTCQTCDTCQGQATCQTCVTDCAVRTCVTCDTCNPHIPTCGHAAGCI
jgi:hypothetical protein